MTIKQIIANLQSAGLLQLAKRIALRRGLTVESMFGRDRSPAFAWARFEFWATVHTPHGVWSLKRLSDVTCRHHTTILNGIQRHNSMAKERSSAEENEVS